MGKIGKIKSKGKWKNGQREGEWISYKENGSIDQKAIFKNGYTTNREYPMEDY